MTEVTDFSPLKTYAVVRHTGDVSEYIFFPTYLPLPYLPTVVHTVVVVVGMYNPLGESMYLSYLPFCFSPCIPFRATYSHLPSE
jgi:hypothetical protein